MTIPDAELDEMENRGALSSEQLRLVTEVRALKAALGESVKAMEPFAKLSRESNRLRCQYGFSLVSLMNEGRLGEVSQKSLRAVRTAYATARAALGEKT